MSTVNVAIAEGPCEAYIATWAEMAAGDVGQAIDYVGHADRTVQMFGTFGGSLVELQGSLDGSNWATLNDAQGNAISIDSARLEAVTELPLYIRPAVIGGTGGSITVKLFMRKTI